MVHGPIYGLLERGRFCDEWLGNSSYLEERSHAERPFGVKGVCRLARAVGAQPVLATAYHRRPNGLAFSPDGRQLWVADSSIGAFSWTACPLTSDPDKPLGQASQVLTPAALGCALGVPRGQKALKGGEGLSGGFKVDERGWLWTSMPSGFAVIDPAGTGGAPRVVCEIALGVNTSNVAFGGDGDVWLAGKGVVWRIRRRAAAAAGAAS